MGLLIKKAADEKRQPASEEPLSVKIWIVTASALMLASCSYLPSTDLLNSAPPDKQMSYRFDTSQTAAEQAPEAKPVKGKAHAKKQRTARTHKGVKQPDATQQPAEEQTE